MSLMIQNNYTQRNSITADTKNQQRGNKVFSKEFSSQHINETAKTEEMTAEEEMQAFKKEFHEELSKVNHHKTVSNAAINISEDAFKKMKEDPEYKEKVLNLIKRDLGSSYAPRDASVLITIGGSLKEYRADAWPVGYDSEFDARSQNSFYKKTSKSKKQKELMEEYLEKRHMTRHIEQEIAIKKVQKQNDRNRTLRNNAAKEAYN